LRRFHELLADLGNAFDKSPKTAGSGALFFGTAWRINYHQKNPITSMRSVFVQHQRVHGLQVQVPTRQMVHDAARCDHDVRAVFQAGRLQQRYATAKHHHFHRFLSARARRRISVATWSASSRCRAQHHRLHRKKRRAAEVGQQRTPGRSFTPPVLVCDQVPFSS
jgi:hypothetical protein